MKWILAILALTLCSACTHVKAHLELPDGRVYDVESKSQFVYRQASVEFERKPDGNIVAHVSWRHDVSQKAVVITEAALSALLKAAATSSVP